MSEEEIVDPQVLGLVGLLRNVPGVVSAEADADPTAPPSVRVALAPDADGALVAEAVSRLMAVQLGGGEPASAPTVTVTGDEAPPPAAEGTTVPPQRPGAAERLRPGIVRTDVALTDLDALAHVVLRLEGADFAGDATGAATGGGLRGAIARATATAVEELAGGSVRVEVDHVDVTVHGEHRTALVGLTLVTMTGAERLTGSAAVREDESRAIVRAVLDAVNRRLGSLGV